MPKTKIERDSMASNAPGPDNSALGRGSHDHLYTRCTLVAAPLTREYEFVSLAAHEELGRPYRVEASLLVPQDHSFEFLELLGKNATVIAERPGSEAPSRRWTGLISAVDSKSQLRASAQTDSGQGDRGTTLISIVLVPALHTGTTGLDSRIFQGLTAVEIIECVLQEVLTPYKRTFDSSRLDRSQYIKRDYCTQYKESNLDFLHRLMEEEGIGYFFDTRSDDDSEALILFDEHERLEPISHPGSGVLVYSPIGTDRHRSDVVSSFDFRIVHGADSLILRDFDWAHGQPSREARVDPKSGVGTSVYQHGFGEHAVIHEDGALLHGLIETAQSALIPLGWPGGALGLLEQVVGTAIGGFTKDDVQRKALIRHELLRRDLLVGAGTTTALALAPGVTFELVGHPTLGVDGAYLVTKVKHSTDEGTSNSSELRNSFECIPLAVAWRPLRRTRRPRIYSMQTATVTGPPGMEIHTDAYGRIQVAFHWDRQSRGPFESSSCWIRCSQVWAGAGHPGFSFIPRVGMEVIVTFVDGDPDRPLVIGCVHNAAHSQPVALPIQATKSVIRTRTVPYSTGYNELSFEDARGHERVHIRAERDLDKLVKRDHTAVVNRDERTVVKRDLVRKVGRNIQESASGDRICAIGKSERVQVGGDAQRHVQGSQSETVFGAQDTVIHGHSHQLHVTDGVQFIEAARGLIHKQAGNALSMFSPESHRSDEPGPNGVELRSPDEVRVAAGDTRISMNGAEPDVIALATPQAYIRIGDDKIELALGGSKIEITPTYIRVNNKTFPA